MLAPNCPSYIPADFEVWPIYYNTIMKILFQHPDVHDAAAAAVRDTAQKLKGLENRDIPPAPAPPCRTGLLAFFIGANLSPRTHIFGGRYSGPLPTVAAEGPRTLEPRPKGAGHYQPTIGLPARPGRAHPIISSRHYFRRRVHRPKSQSQRK